MGCIESKRLIDKDAKLASNLIDEELKSDAVAALNQVKVLLFGDKYETNSITKQMMLFHDGYSEQERIDYKPRVYAYITMSMMSILTAMESLDIPFAHETLAEDSKKLYDAADDLEDLDLTGELGELLKILWRDDGVKKCYSRSREYQPNDSAAYYLDELERLCDSSYIPSVQDVLLIPVKTTGIIETKFEYKNLHFTLIDVEGQRSKQKKWIHCFQDVTAIMFCVDLAAYDQMLAEDEEINQMLESLKLFESICNNSFFSKTSMILLLGNKDLFEEKIENSPLTICFPEYEGKNEYEEASEYVREQFEAQNKHAESKEIYTHFTCATDMGIACFAFDAVADVLMREVLDSLFKKKKKNGS